MAHALAADCAAVVQTRSEILWAKEVITRWWRKIKARNQRKNTTSYQQRPKLVSQKSKMVKRRF